MKKFMVLYYATKEALEKTNAFSTEELKVDMDAWIAWAKKCGGHLIDLGSPLTNGFKSTTSGGEPSKNNVMGYSILQAENMDEAKSLLKNHPHLGSVQGCNIEIYECVAMPI